MMAYSSDRDLSTGRLRLLDDDGSLLMNYEVAKAISLRPNHITGFQFKHAPNICLYLFHQVNLPRDAYLDRDDDIFPQNPERPQDPQEPQEHLLLYDFDSKRQVHHKFNFWSDPQGWLWKDSQLVVVDAELGKAAVLEIKTRSFEVVDKKKVQQLDENWDSRADKRQLVFIDTKPSLFFLFLDANNHGITLCYYNGKTLGKCKARSSKLRGKAMPGADQRLVPMSGTNSCSLFFLNGYFDAPAPTLHRLKLEPLL